MKQARTAETNRPASKSSRPQLYLVRLESETDDLPCAHEAFVDAESSELVRRQAMVAQLKERVRLGLYQPNLELVARRMLA